MHILIDENVPVPMLEMLRRVLPKHEIRHVSEIKWAGKKDLALLPDAARKGFHAFLTKDGRQLEVPSEIAAMPLIVRELDQAESQQLVHIKGLNPASRHRFDLIDPAKSTPSYWPR
ncbi:MULTISPECIES: hypothetical protein [unclassified Streptomyces]|uniref:PIN-like domain-containing protein n=1 Tax=unclassified Streptomyces TaxID=2593676 RepID=UPI002E2E1237|nr:hypothetical protein [Streptomyces sp. NBC_00223]